MRFTLAASSISQSLQSMSTSCMFNLWKAHLIYFHDASSRHGVGRKCGVLPIERIPHRGRSFLVHLQALLLHIGIASDMRTPGEGKS